MPRIIILIIGQCQYRVNLSITTLININSNQLLQDQLIKKGLTGMSKPQDVNDAEFGTEVIDSEIPVLVDFWAEWCGPCKMIAPVVEELASEYDGKAKFVKLNVDFNPETSAKYGVRSIPTLLIFKGGAPVGQVVGAVPKQHLQARLDDALDT